MELIANQHVVPVTALTIFQQGTYAGSPADSSYRWMASIARDNVQDILLGYSLGNSVRYIRRSPSRGVSSVIPWASYPLKPSSSTARARSLIRGAAGAITPAWRSTRATTVLSST